MVAGNKSKLGQPEIKLGTIPGIGGTQRLPRAVGKAKAMLWVLTGRMISAAEAESMGLVSCVVEESNVQTQALGIAREIVQWSRPACQLAKQAINTAFETSLDQGLAHERRNPKRWRATVP